MVTNGNASPSDAEVIKEVLQGNHHRFAILVQRYQALVFTVAYRYTQNREDAEDLAQSAFVKAYKYLPGFRSEAKFSTWLYTIVNSLSLTFIKSKKQALVSLNENSWEHEPAGDQYADALVHQRSTNATLHAAIEKLSQDDQTVLSLFYLAEQSLEEAAGIMAIDKNTFKVKLHRARNRLRSMLETHFSTELDNLQNHY